MMWRCLALVSCIACNSEVGSGWHKPDARTMVMLDAEPDDAAVDAAIDAPAMVSLSQTTNESVVANASVACISNGYTTENSWYRVFDLADHGITEEFHVTEVIFGVEKAAGTQNVQVKIGIYDGTIGTNLNTGNSDFAGPITYVNMGTVNVPANTGYMTRVPVEGELPANSKLIVSVRTPGATGQAPYFYVGASNTGENRPGFIRAPACGISQPTTTGSIGFPNSHLLISVVGYH